MGFALLGAIVGQVAGVPIAEYLRSEFFEPLGMADTALGVPDQWLDRIAPCVLEAGREPSDWDWNSPYWRRLGAPWGGLVTTPHDLARYCRMMLDEGTLGRARVLSPAGVRAMTSNQLVNFPMVPEEDRRCRPWGLGWRLCWPGASAYFGDLLGPRTYGHWGATGTVAWIDPDADAFCILLTTQPCGEEGRHLARVSSCVAASLA
jgi:CubicO group peptidase (beta-lactamase class C family)